MSHVQAKHLKHMLVGASCACALAATVFGVSGVVGSSSLADAHADQSVEQPQSSTADFRSFTTFIGQSALNDIYTTCKFATYNVFDGVNDAATLDHVSDALSQIKAVNAYRASVGLPELRISAKLMVQAQCDAHYADKNIAHPQQFNVGENLAWTYNTTDGYSLWLGEKADFDTLAAQYGGQNLVGRAAYDFYTAHQQDIEHALNDLRTTKPNAQIGHYLNLINPNYYATGFGVCTYGSTNGWIAASQVFDLQTPKLAPGYHVVGTVPESNESNTQTVADFEAQWNAFKERVQGQLESDAHSQNDAGESSPAQSDQTDHMNTADDSQNTTSTTNDSPATSANAPYFPELSALKGNRISGDSYAQTMQAISQAAYQSADVAILATKNGYWDALSASALAGAHHAPLLLCDWDAAPTQTIDELKRLHVKKVIVCGGTAVVPDNVIAQLNRELPSVTVERVFGNWADDTAVRIAERIQHADTCFVTTSAHYADALSASSLAYAKQFPIFLTNEQNVLSDTTLAAIHRLGVKRIVIVGGTAAVSDNVQAQLTHMNQATQLGADITRVAGETWYDTSRAIADLSLARGFSANRVGITTSWGYTDALCASALCGSLGAPLLLADDTNPKVVAEFLRDNHDTISQVNVFGGDAVVGSFTLHKAHISL